MSHSALISDSSSSFSLRLAESFRSRGGEAFLTASAAHVHESPAPGTILWNRLSLLSARTVSVSMKNRCESVDSVVFVYDGPETEDSCARVSLEESAAFLEEWNRGLFLLSAVMEEHLRAQNRESGVRTESRLFSPRRRRLRCWKRRSAALREAARRSALRRRAACKRCSSAWKAKILRKTPNGWPAARHRRNGRSRWIKSGSRPLFGKF